MSKRNAIAASILLSAVYVFAADAPSAQFFGSSVWAAALGVGIAAGLCGIGMGLCISSALAGIARQPELSSKLQLNMMIGLAFIESLVLYVLFIAIILLFANPFAKAFGHM